MEYLIGLVLALIIASFAMLVGFDRERAFYPTVLIVVALYYVLFAAMGASARVLGLEIAAAITFSLVAAVGFRHNPWIIVAGLIGHGLFDFVHASFIQNLGVPQWWPGFCGAYDVAAGGWLAMRILKVFPTSPIAN